MSDVEIRMVQQMSGSRGDGTAWPPVGGTLTVSAEEARQLCDTSHGSPIAVPAVSEERRTETGDAPASGKTETRDDKPEPPKPAAQQQAPAGAAKPAPAAPSGTPGRK